jgi:RNA polymerase sigma-70 factor (ECF subfamily)
MLCGPRPTSGRVRTTSDHTLDLKSQRELFDRHGPMVLRRARAILGHDADAQDACQDVFVRIFSGELGVDRKSSVTAWLWRVTTNLCLNRLRDARRRRELVDLHLRPVVVSTSDTPDPLHVALRAAVLEAPEDEAMAAVLVHIDGMSHAEAAEVLGVSRRTIGNLLSRFERHMLRALEPARGGVTKEAR